MDNWPNDFTPMLELEKRKSANIYRVYILQEGKWKQHSKHRNDLHAFIVKDVKSTEGYPTKITFNRKVIFESKEAK